MKNITFIIYFFLFTFIMLSPIQNFSFAEDEDNAAIDDSRILAQVGDRTLSMKDFNEYLSKLKEIDQQYKGHRSFEGKTDFDNLGMKKHLLNNIIKDQILTQIALEKGLDKKYNIANLSQEEKDVELPRLLVSDLAKEVIISDTDIKNFYEKHKHALRNYNEKMQSLSEAKNDIELMLKSEKLDQIEYKLIKEFMAKRKVQINEELLR